MDQAREAGRLLPEVTIRMLLPPALREVVGGGRRPLGEVVRLLAPLARDGRDALLQVGLAAPRVEEALLAWAGRLVVDDAMPEVRVAAEGREADAVAEALAMLAERGVPVARFRVLGSPVPGDGPLLALPSEAVWSDPERMQAWLGAWAGASRTEAGGRAGAMQVVAPSVAPIGVAVETMVTLGRSPIWKDFVRWPTVRARAVLPVRNVPYPGELELVAGLVRECRRPEEEGDVAAVLLGEPRDLPHLDVEATDWREWVESASAGSVDEAIVLGGALSPAVVARIAMRTGRSEDRGLFVGLLCGDPASLLLAASTARSLAGGYTGVFEPAVWGDLAETLETCAREDEERGVFALVSRWGVNRGNAVALVRWMKAHRARVPGDASGEVRVVAVDTPEAVGVWVESWRGPVWSSELARAFGGAGVRTAADAMGCWICGLPAEEVLSVLSEKEAAVVGVGPLAELPAMAIGAASTLVGEGRVGWAAAVWSRVAGKSADGGGHDGS